jgi:cephalosporin hydroxylase
MKLDAHCAVDNNFDIKLIQSYEKDWTVVPRMYNLDVESWKPKLHKKTDYMYISSLSAEKPFRVQYYEGKEKDDYQYQPNNNLMIDDIMCCMGPGWFMSKDRFWKLEGMDEKHGSWGQMGIEVACKAWLSGGSLKVNKNTWFAHWFRGDIGFPYPVLEKDHEKAREYSRDLWINNKWKLAVRKFDWMIKRFNPPGWKEKDSIQEVFKKLHRMVETHPPVWRGEKIIKFPSDLVLYQQIIWEKKPEIIIELGTAYSGGALFLGDMLEITGQGKVISIDKSPVKTVSHPRIEYIIGKTTDYKILKEVEEKIKGKSCMVILDSDHSRRHVKRELYYYNKLVTVGQYMVVEDIYRKDINSPHPGGPGEAVDWFLKINKNFKRENLGYYLYYVTQNGWLKKLR